MRAVIDRRNLTDNHVDHSLLDLVMKTATSQGVPLDVIEGLRIRLDGHKTHISYGSVPDRRGARKAPRLTAEACLSVDALGPDRYALALEVRRRKKMPPVPPRADRQLMLSTVAAFLGAL